MNIKAVAGWVVAVGGAVAMIYTGFNHLPVPDSVAEYHTLSTEEALSPMQKSLDNIEVNAVVDRIMRIQENRCGNDTLQRIVNEQMYRYHQLTGREFRLTPCPVVAETEATP